MKEDIPLMLEREFAAPDSVSPLLLRFYLSPRQSAKKSAQAGHPVFEDREFVEIRVPGDKQSNFDGPATELHIKRFPKAYAAFKTRESNPSVDGMPLEEWPQLTRSMVMTLKAAGIYTVEALAAINDNNLGNFGHNMRELREKARAFKDLAENTAAAQKIAADNARKDAIIADLQKQIKDLAARMDGRHTHTVTDGEGGHAAIPEKRGPGRPRKVEAA